MESTTMEWAVKEIQLRLPSSGCEIVLPTVVAGAISQYNNILNEHDSDQFMQWCERLSAASRVLVLLHSELPRHYTLLERKRVAEGEYQYKFWDSLKPPAETALARAQAFMDCLQWGAVPTTACNHRFQPDAWSCGFFSLHFLEEQVREHLQEPTVRSPVSLSRMITHINLFILRAQPFLPPPNEPSPPAAELPGASALSAPSAPVAELPSASSLLLEVEASALASVEGATETCPKAPALLPPPEDLQLQLDQA